MQLLSLGCYFTSHCRGLPLSPAHPPGATVLIPPGAAMAAAPSFSSLSSYTTAKALDKSVKTAIVCQATQIYLLQWLNILQDLIPFLCKSGLDEMRAFFTTSGKSTEYSWKQFLKSGWSPLALLWPTAPANHIMHVQRQMRCPSTTPQTPSLSETVEGWYW